MQKKLTHRRCSHGHEHFGEHAKPNGVEPVDNTSGMDDTIASHSR